MERDNPQTLLGISISPTVCTHGPHVVLIKSDEMFWLFYTAVIKERKEEEITGLIKRDSSGSPFTISICLLFSIKLPPSVTVALCI